METPSSSTLPDQKIAFRSGKIKLDRFKNGPDSPTKTKVKQLSILEVNNK